MRFDRGRTALARVSLLAALVLPAGCMNLGSFWRDREGQAALDEVRLKGPQPDPAPAKARQPGKDKPPPQDDLLRRVEAEERVKPDGGASKAPPRSKQEQDQEEAMNEFRAAMPRMAQAPDPGDRLEK